MNNSESFKYVSLLLGMRYKTVEDFKYKLNVISSSFIELYGCGNKYANGIVDGLKLASSLAEELLEPLEDDRDEEDDDIDDNDDVIYGTDLGSGDSVCFVMSFNDSKDVNEFMKNANEFMKNSDEFVKNADILNDIKNGSEKAPKDADEFMKKVDFLLKKRK